MPRSLNGVSDKDIRDAIEYLYVAGYVEEMTTDKKYYTEILLKAGADKLNLLLE
jgi:hypothetical protein